MDEESSFDVAGPWRRPSTPQLVRGTSSQQTSRRSKEGYLS